jgi:FMN phosphatase YigB (HAD superfamily)
MIRMIVCDWNGTLFHDTLEEAFFAGLCWRVYWRAARHGDIMRMGEMTLLGAQCYWLYFMARLNPARTLEYIGKVVDLVNPRVIHGLPRSELESHTHHYARRVAHKLDRRVLDPLRKFRQETGVPVGVISSGCRVGVEAALEEAHYPLDFIMANEFRLNGDVCEAFEFAFSDNKAAVLAELLKRRGVNPREVMYIGDSEQDEECFRLVGMPVVSLLARESMKERFFRKHEAFVPLDQAAFDRHLREMHEGEGSDER